jgi:hypothetical protein
MDLSSLLCRFRPVSIAETSGKLSALRFAHTRWLEIEPDLGFLEFMEKTPTTVRGQIFGSASHDYYTTTLLSCITQVERDIDTFAAAVLNRVILQLNFQTRFIGSRGAPEVLVFDGSRAIFETAMANGNAVLGFHVAADAPSPSPKWSECSHINLAAGALFRRPVEEIPAAMKVLGRGRIGCIGVVLEDDVTAMDTAAYQSLRPFFGSDSFFLLAGGVKRVLRAAARLEAAHHGARISSRIYDTDDGERRAVIVASGLSVMPMLDV